MGHFLANIFRPEDIIPEHFKISQPIEQREYLINGELKVWNGNLNPVASPVFVRKASEIRQAIIGSTPLLTTKESLEALDAAVRAYDMGQGMWPTLSVTARIEYIEKFLTAMRGKRAEVVKLLMWEIGK